MTKSGTFRGTRFSMRSWRLSWPHCMTRRPPWSSPPATLPTTPPCSPWHGSCLVVRSSAMLATTPAWSRGSRTLVCRSTSSGTTTLSISTICFPRCLGTCQRLWPLKRSTRCLEPSVPWRICATWLTAMVLSPSLTRCMLSGCTEEAGRGWVKGMGLAPRSTFSPALLERRSGTSAATLLDLKGWWMWWVFLETRSLCQLRCAGEELWSRIYLHDLPSSNRPCRSNCFHPPAQVSSLYSPSLFFSFISHQEWGGSFPAIWSSEQCGLSSRGTSQCWGIKATIKFFQRWLPKPLLLTITNSRCLCSTLPPTSSPCMLATPSSPPLSLTISFATMDTMSR